MELYAVRVPPGAQQLLCRLPRPERERALAIRDAALRGQFVAGRLVARALLSQRLGVGAAQVELHIGFGGAPQVLGSDWNFNISHAQELVVVALCRRLPVGVDIELLRPIAEAATIARQHFHPEEYDWLLSIPVARRSHAFLRLWVCKEAVAKARRLGLSMPLDRWIALPDAAAGGPFETVDGDGNPWRIHPFDLGARHVAALASTRELDVVRVVQVALNSLIDLTGRS